MKRIIITFVFVAPVLAFMATELGGNQQLGRNEESQSKIIENSERPLKGERRILLEKNFTIGEDFVKSGSIEYIIDIEIGPDGLIYTLDSHSGRIRVYDPQGHYLANIREASSNPEPISDAHDLTIDSRGNVYLLTSKKIEAYDPQGHLVKQIPIDEIVSHFSIGPKGSFLAQVHSKEGKQEVVLLGENGKRKKIIASFDAFRLIHLRDQRGKLVLFGQALYHSALHFCGIDGGGAVYGHSSECRITIIDAEGNEVLVIEKMGPPPILTEKEKEQLIFENEKSLAQRGSQFERKDLIRAMQLPDAKPCFIFLKNDGTFSYAGFINNEKKVSMDLFTKEGTYIHRVIMEFKEIIKISKGTMYCLSPKSSSCVDVFRFQLLEKPND